ncbi:Cys-tRNA(Pro) deacylase [Desulfococcus sp.]|uniref:Cys-tRNA(Pro) deacylase n=1 Tax=Desulfococcus sp. TaxID=2025834 RepID=UPI003592FD9B
MTPAIHLLKKSKVPHTVHTYAHDPESRDYGREASEALGVPSDRMFKTLLVALQGGKQALAVAMVPVSGQLDLKALAAAAGAKKAAMADPADAERASGYVVGGISPLGQKKQLPAFIDESAVNFETIYVSAGKRGLQIEMAPEDLIRLCKAAVADIRR